MILRSKQLISAMSLRHWFCFESVRKQLLLFAPVPQTGCSKPSAAACNRDASEHRLGPLWPLLFLVSRAQASGRPGQLSSVQRHCARAAQAGLASNRQVWSISASVADLPMASSCEELLHIKLQFGNILGALFSSQGDHSPSNRTLNCK